MSKSESEDALEVVLTDVGLNMDFGKKYPHEISGGQCQRAAIARALIVSPQILICDEATSALDVIIQSKIINLLRELRNKKNISILFITHDLPLVCTFSDRIIILKNGELMESGKTRDILHNSKSEYTRKLLDSVIRL